MNDTVFSALDAAGAASINPARVDFVTLRLFCAVLRSGSITRGAQQCHLALSAASRRLSDFEDAAGTPLLLRSATGVVPTAAGHVALQHALRLFQGFERLSSELRDHRDGLRGQVRLWANMSALTGRLPPLLSQFMAQHADIRVELEEQLSGDTVLALLGGQTDVGIFAADTPAQGLHTQPFQTDRLVLVARHDHPVWALDGDAAGADTLAFSQTLGFDFVGLNRGSSLLELISRAADSAGQSLRLRVQARSFDAMLQLIAAGLGVGVLPFGVVAASACHPVRVRTRPLSDPWAQRQLVVAVNPLHAANPCAALLVQMLTGGEGDAGPAGVLSELFPG